MLLFIIAYSFMVIFFTFAIFVIIIHDHLSLASIIINFSLMFYYDDLTIEYRNNYNWLINIDSSYPIETWNKKAQKLWITQSTNDIAQIV